uniref:Uncharacterized protein MANES_05G073800 n=1 Tax=Rhizophora mucronata TaxID=61149 RepID=A0A2P2K728_RHIMU
MLKRIYNHTRKPSKWNYIHFSCSPQLTTSVYPKFSQRNGISIHAQLSNFAINCNTNILYVIQTEIRTKKRKKKIKILLKCV